MEDYTKVIFFDFKKLDSSGILDEMPSITGIFFSINGYCPINFTGDSLMHVNVMGKIIYYISICPEFRTLYDIKRHFNSNNIEQFGVSLPNSYNTIIWFESNDDLSGYYCEVLSVRPKNINVSLPWSDLKYSPKWNT